MTYRPSPVIEQRSSADVFDAICDTLQDQAGLAWSRPDPPTEAMIRIFARYWEVVADRLNRALDRNFLAYLDLLGVSPLPAIPAAVPLTFVPVENAPAGIRVPARTQVAAEAGDGDAEPVVFETLRPLEVTTASLRHVFSLDPENNLQTDLSGIADGVVTDDIAGLRQAQPCDHALFIGDATLFRMRHIRRLALRCDIEPGSASDRPRWSVRWSIPIVEGELPLLATSDDTDGLRRTGDVTFAAPAAWPESDVHGVRSCWLSARLVDAYPGNWTPSRLRRFELVAEIGATQLAVEAGVADGIEVDISKDFYPFGPRPAFGSTLYVTNDVAFAHPGAIVAVTVGLTNPHDASEEPPIPRVNIVGHPRVRWEYWNGTRWGGLDAADETRAFRADGVISFRIPADMARSVVAGRDGLWVRARLVSGNYGEDERWEPAPGQTATGMRHRPSTLAPPSIQSLAVSYELTVVKRPDYLLTSDERRIDNASIRLASGEPVPLFGFPSGPRPALYLAFSAQRERFVNQSLTLYVCAGTAGAQVAAGRHQRAPTVLWQIWVDGRWQNLEPVDESEGFTRDGAVAFIVPGDAAARTDFVGSSPLYWLRSVFVSRAGLDAAARLRGMLRNTVSAAQHLTLEDEVLGSSHATPSQQCQAIRTPVLEGEVLQVREAERGGDAGDQGSTWMRWDPVIDFAASGAGDRHYVIDRKSGEIRFGDGRHGRIPPRGRNNIRLHSYRTGGGARGNRPAGLVRQLRTAVPYIDSVTNWMPASGGADMERMDAVRDRGATVLRHRGRAVTIEDYADLARLASPDVGRAECVPLRDLSSPPSERWRRPGVVSVIVIPAGGEPRPVPRPSLLYHVRSHLDRHRNAATELVVVGPEYVAVGVHLKLAVEDVHDGGSVAARIRVVLDAYLHPLRGADGRGWRLGALPERSEIYALCASVPGVAYVHDVQLLRSEERPHLLTAGHFLVCAGDHRIDLVSSPDADVIARSGSRSA